MYPSEPRSENKLSFVETTALKMFHTHFIPHPYLPMILATSQLPLAFGTVDYQESPCRDWATWFNVTRTHLPCTYNRRNKTLKLTWCWAGLCAVPPCRRDWRSLTGSHQQTKTPLGSPAGSKVIILKRNKAMNCLSQAYWPFPGCPGHLLPHLRASCPLWSLTQPTYEK